jgi:hypothetical protein
MADWSASADCSRASDRLWLFATFPRFCSTALGLLRLKASTPQVIPTNRSLDPARALQGSEGEVWEFVIRFGVRVVQHPHTRGVAMDRVPCLCAVQP